MTYDFKVFFSNRMIELCSLFTFRRCAIPELPNDTYELQGEAHESWVRRYIPPSTDSKLDYDECHLYVIDAATTFDNHSRPLNATKTKCTSWVYSDKVFKSTFSKEVSTFKCNAHFIVIA